MRLSDTRHRASALTFQKRSLTICVLLALLAGDAIANDVSTYAFLRYTSYSGSGGELQSQTAQGQDAYNPYTSSYFWSGPASDTYIGFDGEMTEFPETGGTGIYNVLASAGLGPSRTYIKLTDTGTEPLPNTANDLNGGYVGAYVGQVTHAKFIPVDATGNGLTSGLTTMSFHTSFHYDLFGMDLGDNLGNTNTGYLAFNVHIQVGSSELSEQLISIQYFDPSYAEPNGYCVMPSGDRASCSGDVALVVNLPYVFTYGVPVDFGYSYDATLEGAGILDAMHTVEIKSIELPAGTGVVDPFGHGDNPFNIVAIQAPVPEPETYAMMLAGLGLIGWMSRRSKQISA